jgi:predicted metalloprotease with PDZ domain
VEIMTTNLRTLAHVGIALLVAGMFGQLVAAPIQETHAGVAVIHGGVGIEERSAIEQKAADHNLKLTFARKGSGAYLFGVKVVVRNKQGRVVVDTTASGPLLLAKLPDGEYSVAATEHDVTLSQTIAIKSGVRRDWVFRFDLPKGAEPEMTTGKE